ncbi:MAG: hypothetical protein Q4G03_11170, partial [Planctomycetia bacterium]|nr:hypothetical protein [Planctomycetia bacterium]
MKRIVVALFLAFIGVSFASSCPSAVCVSLAQDNTLAVERELCNDSERFEEPFDASTGAFTVSVLARIISQGDEPGNGDQLGMIWNVGSGWNDGARVYYDWRTRRFTFQIGREQGAAGVTTGRSYAYGVLREITAVYDDNAKVASLYIDGELAVSGELDCELNCPEKPLNVGFGGFGVGSNRMYVERVEVWNSALDATTIAQRNASRSTSERAQAHALDLLENSPNSIPVLDSFKDAQTLLAMNLPVGVRARAQEAALWNELRSDEVQYSRTNLQTSDYETVATIVFARANALLALDSERSDGQATTEELEEYGQILFLLQSLQKLTTANLASAKKLGSSTSFDAQRNRKFIANNREAITKFTEKNAECTRLMRELSQAYPRQAGTFAKIDKFDVQLDRIRRMERDALAVYTELCASHVAQKYTRFIYVSVEGSDESGAGTKESPYASLARAFDDVMTRRSGGDETKVVIELSQGEYQVERTARLADCGRVQVRAAEGSAVVLTGARRIKNFQSLADLSGENPKLKAHYERLSPEAREHVLFADLSASGVTDFGRLQRRGYGVGDKVAPIASLYLNGVAQTLSRWPNRDEQSLTFGASAEPVGEKSQSGDDLASGSTFLSDRDRIQSWSLNGDGSGDDIWAFGLYQWEWAANLRRVLAFDVKTGATTFDYPNSSGKYSYYFVNVFEELDQPGEYYVDAKEGLLYFYPPEEFATPEALNDATVEYDHFDQRFIELQGATDVLLRGLTLRGGRESAVAMLNCKRCFFSDGTIEQFGGNAAIINDGSFCGVLNSRLRELGACGVRIQGGDRATLTDCRHIVSNNYISQFSRIDRVYAPALHATG